MGWNVTLYCSAQTSVVHAQALLAIRGDVDITNPATLGPELFQGATQAVCAVGPVFGRTPDGKMG